MSTLRYVGRLSQLPLPWGSVRTLLRAARGLVLALWVVIALSLCALVLAGWLA
jgi:hypothetical protein